MKPSKTKLVARLSGLLCFLALVLSGAAFGQEDTRMVKRVTFYPINLPYVLFGRIQTSVEVDNKDTNNSILVGLHYNWRLERYNIGQKGSGLGFEFQYRIDFNKDRNIITRDKAYVAPYFEHDYLNYDDDNFGGPAETAVVRRTMVGILTGIKREYENGSRLDLFYGIGIGKSNRFGYNNLMLDFKGGIQLGLR